MNRCSFHTRFGCVYKRDVYITFTYTLQIIVCIMHIYIYIYTCNVQTMVYIVHMKLLQYLSRLKDSRIRSK